MAINENDRLVLRDAFIRVFADPGIANIAMEAMPPIDYTSFARISDVENLRLHMDSRFVGVDSRFDSVSARFTAVDARFDSVDARFDRMEAHFEAIDHRFDAFDARFDAMNTKFGALQLSVEGLIDSKLSAQMRLMFLMQLGTIAAVTGIIRASV